MMMDFGPNQFKPMVRMTRGWTAILSLLTMAASLVALLVGCCGSDQWKQEVFREAGLRFSVPANWKVSLRRPGQGVQDMDDPAATRAPRSRDGAVVTALPVLEDAAVIIIATQQTSAADIFARRVADFIPLEGVQFTNSMQPYSLNGLAGFAGEGVGLLPSDGTSVYFRCLILDVDGKPVIVTLYAEEMQRARYEGIFNTIIARLNPIGAAAHLHNQPPPRNATSTTRAANPPLDALRDALVLGPAPPQTQRPSP